MHFEEKMSGIWPENHKQGINFSRFSRTFCQGQGFKVWVAPPYPNLGWVPPPQGLYIAVNLTLRIVSLATVHLFSQEVFLMNKK